MIDIYAGRIGGGKTYTAVELCAEIFAKGGTVCTNVELIWDGVVKLVEKRYGVTPVVGQWKDLRGKDVGLFHRETPCGVKGNPVKVVIDEAHLYFNSRDWAKTERETLAFLTQSRKQYTDVTFITQSETNIDKQFRVLNQFIWRFKDLETARVPILKISYKLLCRLLSFGISSGKHLLQLQYDYDGKTLVRWKIIPKDPLVYGAYDTNALVRDFPRDGVVDSIQLKKTETLKQKIVKALNSKPQSAFGTVKLIIGVTVFVVGFIALLCLGIKWTRDKMIGDKKSSPSLLPASSLPADRGKVTEVVQDNRVKQAAPVEQRVQKKTALYEVYQENFVSWFGRGVLKTDVGTYQVGEMSSRGFVLAVSDRRAKILSPEGETVWVVAEDVLRKGESQQKTIEQNPRPASIVTDQNQKIPKFRIGKINEKSS